PDDAAFVVALLDTRRHDTADPYAVTAHFDNAGTTVLVQNLHVHGVAVLSAKLENVADLYAALKVERTVAVRAGVAFDHVAQVFDAVKGTVAFPVNTCQVIAVLVGTAGK